MSIGFLNALTYSWESRKLCTCVSVCTSLLLNPCSICSLHDRPIIKRRGVEASNKDFIQKTVGTIRWQTSVLEYHFIRLWMPVSFTDREKR